MVVPGIIAGETKFFLDAGQRRIDVVVQAATTVGRHRFAIVQPIGAAAIPETVQGREFTLWDATPGDFERTAPLLHPDLAGRVHAGEQEALTDLRLADNPRMLSGSLRETPVR